MSEDRDVTSAFVRVLVAEFVERRQRWITLDAANERIIAIVRMIPRYCNVQVLPVSALVQRLAETQAGVFTWDGSRLLLTDRVVSDRAAIIDALRAFLAAADDAKAQPSAPTEAHSDLASTQVGALDDFFAGYEKEIMKARLGQDAEPGHD